MWKEQPPQSRRVAHPVRVAPHPHPHPPGPQPCLPRLPSLSFAFSETLLTKLQRQDGTYESGILSFLGNKNANLGVVLHTCHPRAWETEARKIRS